MEVRWIARPGAPLAALGPPVAAIAALALIAASVASSVVSADPGGTSVAPCPPDARPPALAAGRTDPTATGADAAGEPWYQLLEVLDTRGQVVGRRLELGAGGVRSRLDLPAESSAAGPFGDAILVTADDGARSTVLLVDAAAGCSRLVAVDDAVIRRATLDPTGSTLVVHRLARATRASLGIWSRPIAGGAIVRVVAPIPPDPAIGRTFSTELAWSAEGDRLTIQACGERRCRTRILDPGSGRIVAMDGPDQGPLVGLAAGRLVTYAACPGLPCPLLASEVASGRSRVVVPAAGVARIVATPAGPRLVHETAGHDGSIRSLDLASGREVVQPAVPGFGLVPPPDRALRDQAVPAGWVVLADAAGRQLLLNVADGRRIALEVLR